MGIGPFINDKEMGLTGQIASFVSIPMVAGVISAGIAELEFKQSTKDDGIGRLVE
jgi:hypothetical protein